jgi:hypothetical protein
VSYRIVPDKISKGDQFHPELLRIAHRPVTQRAFAIANSVNEVPPMNANLRGVLYGHDASRVGSV